MGYTHYWTIELAENEEKAEEAYSKAILACQRFIVSYNMVIKTQDRSHPARLAGFSAHCMPGKYKGLNVNGTKELGHETFYFEESYKKALGFNFCKTNRKPYDTVVVGCLAIMKHFLGDVIDVSSDGDKDDWAYGIRTVNKLLNKEYGIILNPIGVSSGQTDSVE